MLEGECNKVLFLLPLSPGDDLYTFSLNISHFSVFLNIIIGTPLCIHYGFLLYQFISFPSVFVYVWLRVWVYGYAYICACACVSTHNNVQVAHTPNQAHCVMSVEACQTVVFVCLYHNCPAHRILLQVIPICVKVSLVFDFAVKWNPSCVAVFLLHLIVRCGGEHNLDNYVGRLAP